MARCHRWILFDVGFNLTDTHVCIKHEGFKSRTYIQYKTTTEAIEPFNLLLKGLMLIIVTLELKFKFVKQEKT